MGSTPGPSGWAVSHTHGHTADNDFNIPYGLTELNKCPNVKPVPPLRAKLYLTEALKQASKGGIVISPLQLQILMSTYFSNLPKSRSYEATEEDLKSEQCPAWLQPLHTSSAATTSEDIALTQVFTSKKAKLFTCSSI